MNLCPYCNGNLEQTRALMSDVACEFFKCEPCNISILSRTGELPPVHIFQKFVIQNIGGLRFKTVAWMLSDVCQIVTPCYLCKTLFMHILPTDAVRKFLKGAHVQEALPFASADQREMLITATCPACWKSMFAEPETDESSTAE